MILILGPNFNYLQIGTNVLFAKGIHTINACVVQIPLFVATALEKLSLSK